jgi:hypothetical protein
MLKKLIVGVTAFLGLGACSMTLPVQGAAEDGTETFTGSATGYADGGGTLTLTSNKGRACSGRFVPPQR